MFRTLGNTWKLMKTSLLVLRKDKELILFPVMSGIGVLVVVGIAAGVFGAIGTFGRLDTAGAEAEVQAGDVLVGVFALFAAFFVINYFNAALIGAARVRLKGGDPNLGTGFAAVNKHIGAVFGWSLIAGVVFILLTYARLQSRSFIARIFISLAGAAWAYATFFLIPVLIVEGVGPKEAIKRSAGLFRKTWGEQLVSNFGFGLLQIVAVVPRRHRHRYSCAVVPRRGQPCGCAAARNWPGDGAGDGGDLQGGAVRLRGRWRRAAVLRSRDAGGGVYGGRDVRVPALSRYQRLRMAVKAARWAASLVGREHEPAIFFAGAAFPRPSARWARAAECVSGAEIVADSAGSCTILQRGGGHRRTGKGLEEDRQRTGSGRAADGQRTGLRQARDRGGTASGTEWRRLALKSPK